MDSHRGEESGEMYSPNEQGEYTPADGAQAFTVQGLTDMLLGLESEDMVVEPPEEELILQLEVMMEDRPGHQCPLAFLWNAGMVMHVLKNDPILRDLEYVQVDNPGTTYLFFWTSSATVGCQLRQWRCLVPICQEHSLSGCHALHTLQPLQLLLQRGGVWPVLPLTDAIRN